MPKQMRALDPPGGADVSGTGGALPAWSGCCFTRWPGAPWGTRLSQPRALRSCPCPPLSPTEQRLQAAAGHHGEQARQRERRAHPLQHAAQGAGERPGLCGGGPWGGQVRGWGSSSGRVPMSGRRTAPRGRTAASSLLPSSRPPRSPLPSLDARLLSLPTAWRQERPGCEHLVVVVWLRAVLTVGCDSSPERALAR